jgi:hypothetical protein
MIPCKSQWVLVLYGHLIKGLVVHTQPHALILLLYE